MQERRKMTGAYRKQKEMVDVEERGEQKGSFKKCCAVIKEKGQEADLEWRKEDWKREKRKRSWGRVRSL